MGRTLRRNDRFKKDRRDRNFRKSKKFKDLKAPSNGRPHQPQPIESEIYDSYSDDSNP